MPPILIDVLRLTLWLALLALLFAPIERLFMLRRRVGRRAILADLSYFYFSGLLPTLFLAGPLALVAAGVRAVTPPAYQAAVASLPIGATVAIGLVVAEFGSYFAHRWCHRSPYLWRFHAIHHTPDHLDWLVNTRAHPVDIIFTRLGGLVPLYMLGLDHGSDANAGMAPVIVTLIGTVWSFFVHANVRWRFGWIEQIIATPAFHHWHHTNDEHRDHNFAATLPVVDRLFGTLHLPDAWPSVYGIDVPVRASLHDEIIRPFFGPTGSRSS
jgi:sterol desaturase/sphingolipid hydroxylase (fatty acid hydroxylase superfamily)